VVLKIGYLAVDASSSDPSGLNKARFASFETGVKNLEKSFDGRIKFNIVNYGSTRATLTPEQKASIGQFNMPSDLQEQQAREASETAVDRFVQHNPAIQAAQPDIFAVDLKTTSDKTPFVPGAAEESKFGVDLNMVKGTSGQVEDGKEVTGKNGRVYAVEINQPLDASGKPDPNVLTHEVAHALSYALERRGWEANHIAHANGMRCDGLFVVPGSSAGYVMTAKNTRDCFVLPYRDHTSVMGNGDKRDGIDPLSAVEKDQLGLLDGKVEYVREQGDYDITLSAVTDPDQQATKMVMIPIPEKYDFPFLKSEYRTQEYSSTRPTYILEYSSAVDKDGNALKDKHTVKLYIGRIDASNKLVGSTYAMLLSDLTDPENTKEVGLDDSFSGVFMQDTRIGVKVTLTGTTGGSGASAAKLHVEIK
jgi:hypothetical protein